MDRAITLTRYLTSGIQEGLVAHIKEEVFPVLSWTASMRDLKTHFVVEASINDHCECEGGSTPLFMSRHPRRSFIIIID